MSCDEYLLFRGSGEEVVPCHGAWWMESGGCTIHDTYTKVICQGRWRGYVRMGMKFAFDIVVVTRACHFRGRRFCTARHVFDIVKGGCFSDKNVGFSI